MFRVSCKLNLSANVLMNDAHFTHPGLSHCGHLRSHANTVARHRPGPYLPFVSEKENCCIPCKNYVAKSWRTMKKDLPKYLENPVNRQVFMDGLAKYEEACVNSPYGRISSNVGLPEGKFPVTITASEGLDLKRYQ